MRGGRLFFQFCEEFEKCGLGLGIFYEELPDLFAPAGYIHLGFCGQRFAADMAEIALGPVHGKTGFALPGEHLLVFLDLLLLYPHLFPELGVDVLLAQDNIGLEHVCAEVAPHGLFDDALLIILFYQAGDSAFPEQVGCHPLIHACFLRGPADNLRQCPGTPWVRRSWI